jgi:hypothetical protein
MEYVYLIWFWITMPLAIFVIIGIAIFTYMDRKWNREYEAKKGRSELNWGKAAGTGNFFDLFF